MYSTPTTSLPSGSCDCHMHVYDDRYPANPAWPVPPPTAPAADYRRVQRELRLERAVVVQPNAYGFDNRCTEDAVRDLGPQSRGIATVKPNIPDVELHRLAAVGFRGARCHMLPNAYLSWDDARGDRAARLARAGATGWAPASDVRDTAARAARRGRHRPQRKVSGPGDANAPRVPDAPAPAGHRPLLGEAVCALRNVEDRRAAL